MNFHNNSLNESMMEFNKTLENIYDDVDKMNQDIKNLESFLIGKPIEPWIDPETNIGWYQYGTNVKNFRIVTIENETIRPVIDIKLSKRKMLVLRLPLFIKNLNAHMNGKK